MTAISDDPFRALQAHSTYCGACITTTNFAVFAALVVEKVLSSHLKYLHHQKVRVENLPHYDHQHDGEVSLVSHIFRDFSGHEDVRTVVLFRSLSTNTRLAILARTGI